MLYLIYKYLNNSKFILPDEYNSKRIFIEKNIPEIINNTENIK